MEKIYLCGKKGHGQYALVDGVWFDYLNQFRWYLDSFGYALRNDANGKPVRMHVEVVGTPKGKYTDHINRDRLDNRSENLRIVTMSQNMHNRPKQANNTSGYKGVILDKRLEHTSRRKWLASLQINGKPIRLGYHHTAEEAHRAVQTAEKMRYEV